MVFRLHI